MTEPPIDTQAARLELNARGHRFDAGLDRVADLMDAGDYAAWSTLPPAAVSQASVYRDFRAQYRAAVKAGAIPDDRSAPATEGA